jgi:alpha-tubulin suppressor-like RCC1 family protein
VLDETTTGEAPASTTLPTSGEDAICGDGVAEAEELCDERGATPRCDDDCTPAACGDANLNAAANEACDDGNGAAGDECGMDCSPTKVVDVSLGGAHTCVLFAEGGVRCWGCNADGQLGKAGLEPLGDEPGEMPVTTVESDEVKFVQIAGGGYHTCARTATGNVYCWGQNGVIQTGTIGNGKDLPRPQVVLGDSALDIASGGLHTCAILTGGVVRCWGMGAEGQLGNGQNFTGNLPTDAIGIDYADELALGARHTCVRQGAIVRCWGLNTYGQLGRGHTENIGDNAAEMPPLPVELGGAAIQIAAGVTHTCALLEDGQVQCWGENGAGQLGNGAPANNIGDAPDEMGAFLKSVPLKAQAEEIAAGAFHTCALLVTGTVQCWGYALHGSLGYGTTENIDLSGELEMLTDVDLGSQSAALHLHASHGDNQDYPGGSVCATLVDGTLRCWGANSCGQLGLGHVDIIGDDEVPGDPGPVPF